MAKKATKKSVPVKPFFISRNKSVYDHIGPWAVRVENAPYTKETSVTNVHAKNVQWSLPDEPASYIGCSMVAKAGEFRADEKPHKRPKTAIPARMSYHGQGFAVSVGEEEEFVKEVKQLFLTASGEVFVVL